MTREEADAATILCATVGSTVHGLNLEGTDDIDQMAVCVEPVENLLGFEKFEQLVHRDAAVREGRHDAPSQPGDLDLTVYGLRRYLSLAMQGNPNMLTVLFAPEEMCQVLDDEGRELRSLTEKIVSKQSGWRHLGYMHDQRERLEGKRGQKKVHRPELEEKYGFDTKYAMHTLRLGVQGVELLETGRITLPMPIQVRDYIRAVRAGNHLLSEVLEYAVELEERMKSLIETSELRDRPDTEFVEEWLMTVYLREIQSQED